MTHAEIKEGREAEIHEGDEGITIQTKKGANIHKNASETDPALKIDHDGTDVVKRAREIEVVENTGEEQQAEETKTEEEPAKPAEEGTQDAPVEIVDDEKEEASGEANIEKEVETALEEPDQDVEMESPKKSGADKSAGEKRDRDDLEELEDASPAGEKETEVETESNGENGVKKHKTEHSDNDEVAAVGTAEEIVDNAPAISHIDENLKKVEAEESAVAAREDEGIVPA